MQTRILVVDDETKTTDEIRDGLENVGYSADTCNDPETALSNFKSGIYDLMILDIGLPRMDGFTLYEKIRDLDGKVRVCFMSDSKVHDEEFLTLFPIWNARDFFHKPVTIRELVEHIKDTLKEESN
ncbi:MAG: response regulator [Thermoproteota archaeon]|nr:response regulator [Thermoproteota archaeon]